MFVVSCTGKSPPLSPPPVTTPISQTASSAPDLTPHLRKLEDECPEDSERQGCLEQALLALVPSEGPESVMQLLTTLLEQGTLRKIKDYHDFVHRIGRTTAKTFGVTPQAFFRCPRDFNYGCQHGFFEQALIEVPDLKEAALRVCDREFFTTEAPKSLFYCFHGVGHGVMMARAYDLTASLQICDSFDFPLANQGCWQGVFMENVNGAMEESLGAKRMFSDTDMLAPCNNLHERYQWECYINHAGYLVPKAGSLERATAECLRAAEPARHACLQGIGLMATNPAWQLDLIDEDRGSLLGNALVICQSFPSGYAWDCIQAAVDNLSNFDREDTRRPLAFCGQVNEAFQARCYEQVGRSARKEIPAGFDAASACSGAPEPFRSFCLQGLGV